LPILSSAVLKTAVFSSEQSFLLQSKVIFWQRENIFSLMLAIMLAIKLDF
jgi:hypothetical protein